jgi:hypothetical protein
LHSVSGRLVTDHGQDAGPDRFGQVGPRFENSDQIGVDRDKISAKCTDFRSAFWASLKTAILLRLFESLPDYFPARGPPPIRGLVRTSAYGVLLSLWPKRSTHLTP